MYSGGLAAKEDAAKRAEEHLLGKPAVLQAQQEDASRVSTHTSSDAQQVRSAGHLFEI